MNETPNEIVEPVQTGEPAAESINWGDAPPEVAPPAPEATTPPEAAPTPAEAPVAEAPAPEANPDFSFATLENGDHEVRLATGQVYKGKTEQEAWANVARAQVEASRTIQQLRSQPPPTPVTPPFQQQVTPPVEMDEATMAIADLLAPAFGAKNGAELVEGYKRMQQTQNVAVQTHQEMQNNQVAAEFVRTTQDLVITPANIAKLGEVFDQTGLPMTVENMRMVHYSIKGQGLYEAPVTPNATAQPVDANRAANGQFTTKSNMMPMPPNSSNSSAAQAKEMDPFKLSDADFEKEFASRMTA